MNLKNTVCVLITFVAPVLVTPARPIIEELKQKQEESIRESWFDPAPISTLNIPFGFDFSTKWIDRWGTVYGKDEFAITLHPFWEVGITENTALVTVMSDGPEPEGHNNASDVNSQPFIEQKHQVACVNAKEPDKVTAVYTYDEKGNFVVKDQTLNELDPSKVQRLSPNDGDSDDADAATWRGNNADASDLKEHVDNYADGPLKTIWIAPGHFCKAGKTGDWSNVDRNYDHMHIWYGDISIDVSTELEKFEVEVFHHGGDKKADKQAIKEHSRARCQNHRDRGDFTFVTCWFPRDGKKD